MIRTRSADGTVQEIPKGVAVEVCSVDGKIARVIMWAGRQVLSLGPGDRGFDDYCRAMRTPSAEVVELREN